MESRTGCRGMKPDLEITWPRDGDILNRHDGEEKDGRITITVQGRYTGPPPLRVNGEEAVCDGQAFTCRVTLKDRESIVTARGRDTQAQARVWWLRGSRRRFRFSVDDNICFLRDLGTDPARYPSLFDHWYLAFWKIMHEAYGAKTHLNIYYQTDGFDLTQMPDRWKQEWEENAYWLHLSFHALQDKPDRPYRNAAYTQLAHDCDLVTGHIRRFAGNRVLGNTTTIHWAECRRDAAFALRDRGIENLIALFDRQGYEGDLTTGYYLSPERCAHADTRCAWHDFDTGLTFIRCTLVVNAHPLEKLPARLDARTSSTRTDELIELLIHEQYFRKELPLYQPDVEEKVRACMRWVTERGYEPAFWDNVFPV
jgi:hypothetical protein